jgi:hypothetical protein
MLYATVKHAYTYLESLGKFPSLADLHIPAAKQASSPGTRGEGPPMLSPGCSQARQALAAARLNQFRFPRRPDDKTPLMVELDPRLSEARISYLVSLSPPKISPTSVSPRATYESLLATADSTSVLRSHGSEEHSRKTPRTELLQPLREDRTYTVNRGAASRIANAANKIAQAASDESESLKMLLDVHERSMRSVYARVRTISGRSTLARPQSAAPSKSKTKKCRDPLRTSAVGVPSTESDGSRCSSSASCLTSADECDAGRTSYLISPRWTPRCVASACRAP